MFTRPKDKTILSFLAPLAGPDSLPLWLCRVCAFVLLRCFSCSHTVLPKEHILGIIFFSSLSSCKCCIFLQFYLHFTTDYTCMIVYVTNNKEPWDWFVTIDLKDAYFHIQVIRRHRKFLQFAFGGKAYQYKVLPFGLALALRTFTKCMDAALVPLRFQGIRVLNYLDDWLILAHSREFVSHHRDIVLHHIRSLGLRMNCQAPHAADRDLFGREIWGADGAFASIMWRSEYVRGGFRAISQWIGVILNGLQTIGMPRGVSQSVKSSRSVSFPI